MQRYFLWKSRTFSTFQWRVTESDMLSLPPESSVYDMFLVVCWSPKQCENLPRLIPKRPSLQHSPLPYSFLHSFSLRQLLTVGSLTWSSAHQDWHEKKLQLLKCGNQLEQLFELTMIQPWGVLILQALECINRQVCVFGNICISCSLAVTLVA